MVNYTFDPKEGSTDFLHFLKSEVGKAISDLMKAFLREECIGMYA